MPVPMRFSVLGGLRAWRDDQEVELGARQPRLMIAMLLARAGRPVPVSELIALLWGDDPPPTAVNVVHRHIGAIRRAIEPGLARRVEGDWLVRRPGGYRLSIDAGDVDLLFFRELAVGARADLKAGRREEAITAYQAALELWHGVFGAGLGAQTHPLFVSVNRERSTVARAAADAALGTRAAASLLPGLRAAAAADPFDEGLQARLLLLLAEADRPGEAIERYHRVRERMAADLGTGPGPELIAALETILRTPQPELVATAVGAPMIVAAPAPRPPEPAPARLPPGSALFSGRTDDLEALDRLLDEGDRNRFGATVIGLDGIPGVGKTALAVHWAHTVAHRYPDGRLFLDLHGFSGDRPMASFAILARLLCSIGVPDDELPATAEARVALLRTLTSDRRLLMLLDDVRDPEQVRPVIPAAPNSLVILTSRSRLTALAAANGARLRTVMVPSEQDARALLLARLGGPATGDPREAAALKSILAGSGRLPLAMAIIGERMSAHAPVRLSEVAEVLDQSAGLDAFTGNDVASDLRAVFERSYRRLGPEAAQLFRQLGDVDASVDPAAAADLTGVTRAEATSMLSELAGAGLVTRGSFHRYTVHDLVRTYARELDEQTPTRPRSRLVSAAGNMDREPRDAGVDPL